MCKAAEELHADWMAKGREEAVDDMRNRYESMKAAGRSSDEILSILFP